MRVFWALVFGIWGMGAVAGGWLSSHILQLSTHSDASGHFTADLNDCVFTSSMFLPGPDGEKGLFHGAFMLDLAQIEFGFLHDPRAPSAVLRLGAGTPNEEAVLGFVATSPTGIMREQNADRPVAQAALRDGAGVLATRSDGVRVIRYADRHGGFYFAGPEGFARLVSLEAALREYQSQYCGAALLS